MQNSGLPIEDKASNRVLKCPKDGTELADSSKASVCDFVQSGYDFHECPSCKGVWISRHVLQRMLSDHALQKASSLSTFHKQLSDKRVFEIQDDLKGNLWCPSDGERLFILHHKGVELDLCGSCCGMWLDKGELAKVRKRPKSEKDSLDLIGSDLSFDLIDLIFEFLTFH